MKKSLKIISLIMSVIMVVCCFVSCAANNENGEKTIGEKTKEYKNRVKNSNVETHSDSDGEKDKSTPSDATDHEKAKEQIENLIKKCETALREVKTDKIQEYTADENNAISKIDLSLISDSEKDMQIGHAELLKKFEPLLSQITLTIENIQVNEDTAQGKLSIIRPDIQKIDFEKETADYIEKNSDKFDAEALKNDKKINEWVNENISDIIKSALDNKEPLAECFTVNFCLQEDKWIIASTELFKESEKKDII